MNPSNAADNDAAAEPPSAAPPTAVTTLPTCHAFADAAVNQHLSGLVGATSAGLLILDAAGVIRFANPAAARLLATPSADLIGRAFDPARGVGTAAEVPIIGADGQPGVALLMLSPASYNGAPAQLALLCDISAHKAAEEQMRRLAFTDPLTELPNRNLFVNRLEQAICLARRERKGVAVVFMDIDRFKGKNDTLGHAFGDSLLQGIAARLRASLRAPDTVARMGGDEFTAIVYGVADCAAAELVADRLGGALEPPFLLEGQEFFISASMGVALYPHHGSEADLLLRQADSAMYEAKRSRRGSVVLYRAGMTTLARTRLALENDLHAALANHQFRLLYQPQIDLGSGAMVGVEALLRWQHPTKGLLEPAYFLPMLEDTGMMIEVGRWVLREACRQIRHWQATRAQPVTVAVNVSAAQIEYARFVEQVGLVLAEEAIDPGCLTNCATSPAV